VRQGRRQVRPPSRYTPRVGRKVVVVAPVEPLLIERLREDSRFDVAIRTEGPVEERVRDAEIVVTRTITHVTRELIDAAPRLQLIVQGTSGIDNIDVAAAAERGIAVVNLPGVNANAVAELVIGIIISLTRTVPAYSRQVASGIWRRDDCATRHELRHYALGIVGHGNVGSRVSRLATAFGMKPRAYDPYIGDFGAAARVATLDELLATSDILTLHIPLTDETRMMIGAREIRRMRRGSFLINAARGEVLDWNAALAALADEHLGGLAVDVFDDEPPQRTYADDPRLILTPHIAGCTFEAKLDASELLYAKICEWVDRQGGRAFEIRD
jgi:phosphoglycerate dehydrogenase-like enzyme